MKKSISLLVLIIVALGLTACGGETAEVPKSGTTVNPSNSVASVIENNIAKESDQTESTDTSDKQDSNSNQTIVNSTAGSKNYSGFSIVQLNPNKKSENTGTEKLDIEDIDISNVDIDIAELNDNVAYAEISNLLMNPSDHIGDVVRMRGLCTSSYYDVTNKTYYICAVQDATACCTAGMEFIPAKGYELPTDNEEIIITGVFESYDELGQTYYRLNNTKIEVV